MEDQYFGPLKTKIADFMADVDEQLWKLGITVKTQHNEVAPGQHEIAPIFAPADAALDSNFLVMDVLKSTATKHGLACLLHDAAEAYMSDLPRPLKAMLPQYSVAEERLLRVIWQRLAGEPLSHAERRVVGDVDDDMMSWEFHCMMAEEVNERWRNLKSPPTCRFEPFDDVELRYKATAAALRERCRSDSSRG